LDLNLGRLITQLILDNSSFARGIDDSLGKLDGLSGGLARIGGGITTALGGAALAGITALGAGMVDSIGATSKWGSTLDDIGDILGGSTTQMAGLALMQDRIGQGSDQVSNALAKMSMGLQDSSGNLGSTGKILDSLGISFKNSDGSIKDAYVLYGEVADKLGPMKEGLDKTQLMMGLFGKSGKLMSDSLSAAAGGGLKSFQDEANNLGLALDPQKVIDYQKSQAKLDETLLGLKVTAGSGFITVLQNLANVMSKALANPQVKSTIDSIAQGVSAFASNVISYLPQVITTLEGLPSWFEANQPLIIGILAALGVAVGVFAYAVAIPALASLVVAEWAVLAPLLPAIAVIALVAAAVAGLYLAWSTNFLGIRDVVSSIWGFIKPIFDRFVLGLTLIWSFLSTSVFPLFQAFGSFIGSVFKLQWDIVIGIFQHTLLPILKDIYNHLSAFFMPIIKTIADFVGSRLAPAFSGLNGIIQNCTGFFSNLAGAISRIDKNLPSWMRPGSPMPLTTALGGLNQELDRSAKTFLPAFSAQLNLSSSMPMGQNASLSKLADAINNNKQQQPILDERKLGLIIAQAIAKQTG
jgi:VIT1/CCC1 family predicted Fe2+/Mn2+ transporter